MLRCRQPDPINQRTCRKSRETNRRREFLTSPMYLTINVYVSAYCVCVDVCMHVRLIIRRLFSVPTKVAIVPSLPPASSLSSLPLPLSLSHCTPKPSNTRIHTHTHTRRLLNKNASCSVHLSSQTQGHTTHASTPASASKNKRARARWLASVCACIGTGTEIN